jgi:hypothetical protein
MALVRCEDCGVKPKGQGKYTRDYVRHVLPVGHPHSAIICGKPTCMNPGLIWLEEKESKAYSKGQRIFSLQTATIKVCAQ